MRRPPDCLRLCAALLVSLLLHAALLLPSPLTSPPRLAMRPSATGALVLTATLPTPGGQPPPAAEAPPAGKPAAHPVPATNAPPASASAFYTAERLTRPPRPLESIELDLPQARLLTGSATLVLTLWVDAEGRVVSYEVQAPELPEEYTTAVAEAFRAVRFAPGELRGRKVGSILRLEIHRD